MLADVPVCVESASCVPDLVGFLPAGGPLIHAFLIEKTTGKHTQKSVNIIFQSKINLVAWQTCRCTGVMRIEQGGVSGLRTDVKKKMEGV